MKKILVAAILLLSCIGASAQRFGVGGGFINSSIKQNGEVIGNHVRVKVVKNKIAPPFKEAEFDIMFGKGISREGDILDLAAKEDIVEKSGSWYAYQGSKIGQGRENAKLYLAQNPAVCAEIEGKVREAHGIPADPAAVPAAEAAAPEEE